MGTAKILLAPALARRSRLGAKAASGAVEDFSIFQASFPAVTPVKVTATPTKPAVTIGKAAVSPAKAVITPQRVTVTPTGVAVTPTGVAVIPAGVAVAFHRETAPFARFLPKHPRFFQNSRFSAGFYGSQNKIRPSRLGQTCRAAGWRRGSTALPFCTAISVSHNTMK